MVNNTRSELTLHSCERYGEPFVNFLVDWCSSELVDEEELRQRLHDELLDIIPFNPWEPTEYQRWEFTPIIDGILPNAPTAKYPEMSVIMNISAVLDAIKAYYGK